jgi:uncharacterized protein DUF3485
MTRILPPALAVLLIVATGVVHGMRTGRWHTDPALTDSVARLATLPPTLDDWEGEEVSLNGNDPAGVAGHLCRKYVHRRTGQAVTVFLVCGRPGPVAIHTPDICYSASGFTVGAPIKYSTPASDSGAAEFWTTDMARTTASDRSRMRVFWAWAADRSGWVAADAPRVQFASRPVLFKMYLLREVVSEGDASLDRDPCVEFMHTLLPALKAVIFPSAEGEAG